MEQTMIMFKKRIVDSQKPFIVFSQIFKKCVLNKTDKATDSNNSSSFLDKKQKEEIENRISDFNMKVDQWNVTRTVGYYAMSTKSFSFAFCDTKERQTPIGKVRTKIYFQLPGICKYIDEQTLDKVRRR